MTGVCDTERKQTENQDNHNQLKKHPDFSSA